MKTANITLLFNGQAEAALNFYKSIFGGEFILLQRMKDMPHEQPMTAEEQEKILYASIPIGSAVLMAMDIPASRPQVNEGSNFMITLDTSSEEETDTVFKALSEGGVVMMPVENQFWGAYFGMVKDQFGISWMLSYQK